MIAYFLFVSYVRQSACDLELLGDLEASKDQDGKSQLTYIITYILEEKYQIHWRSPQPYRPNKMMIDYQLKDLEALKSVLKNWQNTFVGEYLPNPTSNICM